MTVYIEKPAVNLREELASLRNQGGYEEQQFYFDGLVTNGTFDADTSGWTAFRSTLTQVSGRLRITEDGVNSAGYARQSFPVEIGKVYVVSADLVSVSGTSNRQLWVSSSAYGSADLVNVAGISAGSNTTRTFTATSSTVYLEVLQNATAGGTTEYSEWDNISVFETDGTDVVHRMPKGWVPLHVYEDGLLQREGAAHDYEVVYDGFDYYVKPAVAPSATTQTCVIGVRK